MNDEEKDHIKDHIDYHIIHDNDQNGEDEEEQTSGPNLAAYALIKYASLILIVLVVLYFIAIFVLPLVRDILR